MKSQVAAYLLRGKSYIIYDLDENLREISSKVVQRNEIPEAVADKCDRYGPYSFREVPIPSDKEK